MGVVRWGLVRFGEVWSGMARCGTVRLMGKVRCG